MITPTHNNSLRKGHLFLPAQLIKRMLVGLLFLLLTVVTTTAGTDPDPPSGALLTAQAAVAAETVLAEPAPTATTISTRVSSAGAGSEGLAVQIRYPATARYAHGAPVAIIIPGGVKGKGLGSSVQGLTEQGFIEITFNFPGSGIGTDISGGRYDYRGSNCVEALKDIALFALGETVDSNNKTLTELVAPLVPLADNIGFIGLSNGGNISLVTAGYYSRQLPLAWLVNWESPIGDGMPNGEAGSIQDENGHNPPFNPAYDATNGSWDLDLLAYDAGIDSNKSHTSTVDEAMLGGFYFDLNRNRTLDPGVDFILYPFTLPDENDGPGTAYYSERVINFADSQNLYDSSPIHLVNPEENSEFWFWRNGEKWIGSIVNANQNVKFMVIATTEDHVQTASDHPHILIQYQGFMDAGASFARLNPDRSYIDLLVSGEFSGAADNSALFPFDHFSIRNALEPETLPLSETVVAAACELSDRVETADNSGKINLAALGVLDVRQESLHTYAEGDRCLILAPEIPPEFQLYSGLQLPSGELYLLTTTNVLIPYADQLFEWTGHPVMLDITIPEALGKGDYLLYTLFVPQGQNPFPFSETSILKQTILSIE